VNLEKPGNVVNIVATGADLTVGRSTREKEREKESAVWGFVERGNQSPTVHAPGGEGRGGEGSGAPSRWPEARVEGRTGEREDGNEWNRERSGLKKKRRALLSPPRGGHLARMSWH
jgi:hypothetical protein